MKSYGIDVSHHQRPTAMPWDAIASSSSVCIVRGSYGTMRDRECAEHIRRARGVGLAVGLYHFYRPSQPWRDQLAVFRAAMEAAGVGTGDVVPALDVEHDPIPKPGQSVSPAWQEGVEAMLAEFSETYGGALAYITQREFGQLGKPAWLLEYPLWVAHYTGASKPATPAGKACVIWQHRVGPYDPDGAGGYFEGGSPQLDQNRILGTLPLIGTTVAPAPEPLAASRVDDDELHALSVQAIAQQFDHLDLDGDGAVDRDDHDKTPTDPAPPPDSEVA